MVKAIVEKPVFLKKLQEIFDTLEDLEHTEDLKKIFTIFKKLSISYEFYCFF